MDRGRGFRLFGFPLHIRPGFLMFMVLVILIYGGSLGLWVAGTMAIFTVIHELGHAFAARMTGATAEISLDFLAGYASYLPSRELRPLERAGIALAGPFTQMTFAVATLLIMGVSPLSRADIIGSEASIAIWWSGVALGLVNLFPALPLDGGLVFASLIDMVAPHRGRWVMIRLSLVFTLLAALLCVIYDWTDFLPFLVLLGILQLRMGRTTVSTDDREMARQAIESLAKLEITSDIALTSIVCQAMLANGSPQDCVSYASAAFNVYPHAKAALFVAEGLAQLKNRDGAIEWLQIAVNSSLNLHQLKDDLAQLPVLRTLSSEPEVVEIFRRAIEERR